MICLHASHNVGHEANNRTIWAPCWKSLRNPNCWQRPKITLDTTCKVIYWSILIYLTYLIGLDWYIMMGRPCLFTVCVCKAHKFVCWRDCLITLFSLCHLWGWQKKKPFFGILLDSGYICVPHNLIPSFNWETKIIWWSVAAAGIESSVDLVTVLVHCPAGVSGYKSSAVEFWPTNTVGQGLIPEGQAESFHHKLYLFTILRFTGDCLLALSEFSV